MKRIFFLPGIAVLLLLMLPGCSKPAAPAPTTTAVPSTTVGAPAPTAQELYLAAREATELAPNRIVSYSATLDRISGNDRYTESVTGTASYSGLGSKDLTAIVEEELELGGIPHSYVEAYCDRTAYAVVSDCYFRSDLSAEAFLQRQLPAVLLDAGLYNDISIAEQDNTTTLQFSDAAAAESWLPAGITQLHSATGTAVLSPSGELIQTEYQCSYTRGDMQYSLSVSLRITTPKELDLSGKHPAHDRECTPLQELSAPRILLQAVAQLYNARHIRCDGLETVYSEAIPYVYSLTSQIRLSGFGEGLRSHAYYRTAVSDYRGQIVSREQTDIYEDGVFSSAVGEGTPTENPSMTAAIVRQRLEDKLLSGLLALKYLDGAAATRQGDTLLLELQGNRLFTKDMLRHLSSTLQLELSTGSAGVSLQSVGGTLRVDAQTGLPTDFSLIFDLTHEKDGVPYRLTYKLEQHLSFRSEDAQ